MSLRSAVLGLWLLAAAGPASATASATADSLLQEGLRSLAQRQTHQAEKALLGCLQTDSTCCGGYLPLGRLYGDLGVLGRADTVLVQGLRVCPERTELRLEYSRSLRRQGRLPEAYAQLQRLLAVAPVDTMALLGIGSLCLEPGQTMDLDRAAAAFTRVLGLSPGNPEAAFQLGETRLGQGDRLGAIAQFESLFRQWPRNFAVAYQLGMALYLEGRYAEALIPLRRAAELAPAKLTGRWGLYLACRALGGYPDDVPAASRLELAPETDLTATSVRLTDVAEAAGVARFGRATGSAWADVDLDGDLDLFTMDLDTGSVYYRNEGGRFVDQTAAAGLSAPAGIGCVFGDYDNDGAPDLYVTRSAWFGRGPNTLFRNDGHGGFADVSTAAGVDDQGSSVTAAWGDVDNDGYLDLVVTNGLPGDGSPNRLFRSDGKGRFVDVAVQAGIAPGQSAGSALGDYDNDGDLDLYIANLNATNVLYRNDTDGAGGRIRYTDVTRTTHTQLPIGAHATFFFDYDNDGHLDLFCSELGDQETVLRSRVDGRTPFDHARPALHHNNGNGDFTDLTYQAGLGRTFGTLGAQYGDLDGDGFQEIYLANGGAESSRLEPDALLWNRGDGRFAEITQLAGLFQLGKAHGVTFADYDGDGDLDVFLPTGGPYPGDRWQSILYRNDGPARHWLTLRLVGTRSNRDAIGARVRVQAGGRTQYDQVSSGGGFGVSNSLQLELGLGSSDHADEVQIRWPSGRVEILTDVAADRVLTVVEGEPRP
ncbi:MAG: FG-GAP-like repeat-containing protein [Candidatus Latescibacterota bacterium]